MNERRRQTEFERSLDRPVDDIHSDATIADRRTRDGLADRKRTRNKQFRQQRIRRNVRTVKRGAKVVGSAALATGALYVSGEIFDHVTEHPNAGRPDSTLAEQNIQETLDQNAARQIDHELTEGVEVEPNQSN